MHTYIRGKLVDKKKATIGKTPEPEKSPGEGKKLAKYYIEKVTAKFKDSFIRDTYFNDTTFVE